MKTFSYRTIIEKDGKYLHGYVPSLPGCHTFGKNIEETRKNLQDAIKVYIESLLSDNKIIPNDDVMETIETISIDEDHTKSKVFLHA